MKPTFIIFIASLMLVGCSTSPNILSRSCYHEDPRIKEEVGMCRAVRVGNTLYISGVSGEGPMPQAIEQAYRKLSRILRLHGLSFDNVISERIYSAELDALVKNKAIRKAYYGDLLPASTWVEVARLYRSENTLEIEATALIPKRRFEVINFDSW